MDHSKGLPKSNIAQIHEKEIAITTVQVVETPIERHQNAISSASASQQANWWLTEVFAWAVSALALVGLGLMLHFLDGKPTPRWALKSKYTRKVDITLNSIVSLFTTVVKATLLIPVAAAISQSKWRWFQKSRPLSHYPLFDDAARGSSGSLKLLWKTKGSSIACLGGIIVVAALGVDFSFQQLIAYPIRPEVAAGIATIPRTDAYSDWVRGEISGLKSVTPSMLRAIYTGIFAVNTSFDVAPVCATGNCTWEEDYFTLGACGQCYNLTQQLQTACGEQLIEITDPDTEDTTSYLAPYCNYSLPNGLSLTGVSDAAGYNVNFNVSSSLATNIQNSSWGPIGSFSIIQAIWSLQDSLLGQNETGPRSDPLYAISAINATECVVDVCVQKRRGYMKFGNFTDTVIATYHNSSSNIDQDGNNLNYYIQPPTSANYTGKSEFFVDPFTYTALKQQFSGLWNGSYTDLTYKGFSDNNMISLLYSLSYDGIEQMIQSLAASMTLLIRNKGSSQANGAYSPAATGTVWQDTIHVQVRWAWLTLPVTLVVLALVLLTATIALNLRNNTMLWKTNSLASFYHPLTSDGRNRLAEAKDVNRVESIADEMRVRWHQTEAGPRLVVTD